jgi:DNA-directed RNA polymerase specialized sigma24 family protein
MTDDDFEQYRLTGDFNAFARATRDDWRRFAFNFMQRWKAPPSVSENDLVQEMLLTCWARLDDWDATRGPTLRTFLTYHALDKARKFLHKARKAGHDGGHGRSRFELAFSSLVRDGDDSDYGTAIAERLMPPSLPDQESLLARSRLRQLAGAFAPVIDTFERTGSLDAAVERCMSNAAAREMLATAMEQAGIRYRVHNFRTTKNGVRFMIQQLAEQVQT